MEYLRADLHTNYITPVADVFQVNHFDAPKIRPEGWTIKVGGLAKWQLDLTMADLEDMPHTEVTAFHECAGSPIHPHIPQRRIANIKWTGVPLALILREIGVDERARYVLSRGADGGTWQVGPFCSAGRSDERRATFDRPRWSRPPRGAGLLRHELNEMATANPDIGGQIEECFYHHVLQGPGR